MNYLLGEFKYKIHPDSREYWQYHFLVSHVSFQSELKFSLLTENPVKLGRKIRDKNCLGFSSDGNYLAFCYEGAVRIFNLSGNRTKRVTFEPTLGYITSICFVPGTADFVIGGQNGRIYLCDITGSFRRVFVPRAAEAYYKGISCLEISHDGTQLAAGYGDTKVRFWNIDNDAQCQTILGSQGAVESLAFSPEGQYFAVGTGTSSCAFSTLNQLHTSYHGNFNTPMSRIQFPSFLMEQDSSLVPDTAARHFIT
jgi:WD40 repeat protein